MIAYSDKKIRVIDIFVDLNKDIVIFPYSEIDKPYTLHDGTIVEKSYLPAYFPIELKYPYTIEELSEKLKYAFDQCEIHPCHTGKQSIQEKYYGIKGKKNAAKGKYCINITLYDNKILYDDKKKYNYIGKRVVLMLPWKSCNSYMGIAYTEFPSAPTWEDLANTAIYYINADLKEFEAYRVYKRDLNM